VPLASAELGRADLHLHTLASDGMMSATALLDHVEHNTDLDVIAITDHDDIDAALVARERALSAGYRVEVVPGVEVTTREGHLLALFVEARPAALRGAVETSEWVIAHGGVCLAPHPFSRWTHSLGGRTLSELARRGLLAGIEVLNASPAGRGSGARALKFARDHALAAVGGSDAHMLRMVGLAQTRFAGRDSRDLRSAIEQGSTVADGRHARADEVAADALPQLARSLVHLPLRRLARALKSGS
jgi:predicted metal-dependent phosphoesterase TrpH